MGDRANKELTGDDGQARRGSPAQALLSGVCLAVLWSLPFLNVASNRLVSGVPVYLLSLLQGGAWGFAGPLIGLFVLAWLRQRRWVIWMSLAMSTLLIPGLVWLAATQATQVALTQSAMARSALGGGFWLSGLLLGLIAMVALQRLRAGSWLRLLVLLVAGLPVGTLVAMGVCDDLSIMREYANRPEVFAQAISRHLQIVGVAMAMTLCLGLPLGWAAHRYGGVGQSLLPLLNIIQTIPSIALFGLLMAPLALLAVTWPAFARMGLSGVGLAPAVIALTLYSLLPVVRGTLAGLAQVPSSVMHAALGLGLSGWQCFWQVEVPLALPVVLGGVRTATVQAVGLTAVTALIGAGGLGAIMFEGLFSSAQDLVLLGVVPMVVMGVLADAGFRLLPVQGPT
jgi:osmoprotectant transport system permease protein